jgi:arylsulfatase A-like enzyme
MKYLKFYCVLFCCHLLCSCTDPVPVIPAENDKLNVLFIIADDLNCDLGSYGNRIVQTPNIDKLSERGLLFENAHNQYPLCGPSRASFMTGMYTDQTKMTQNNVFIRSTVPDAITLGQRFRQQGYQSVRIGKIFHYDNPSTIGTSGMDDIYSWDQTINPYGRDKKEEYKINTLSPRRYGGTLSWLSSEGEDTEQTDGIAASEAIEQLDGFSTSDDNFFLALGFFRPHTPFVAPKKYFDLYNRDSISVPQISDAYLTTLPVPAAKSIRSKKNQLNLPDTLAQEIKQAYYATISFIDAQVGRVLDKLEETGLDQSTIVVFTSDHGYHMGEHGHWQKQTLFENSTRIPLIVSVPGVYKQSERTMTPVELIDVYPTLMDLTDIVVPSHVVGKSLVPVILNEEESIRESALTRWRDGYSMKTLRYRITKWGKEGQLGYELYDHFHDQEELINLVSDSSYSKVLDSLSTALDIRIAQAKVKPDGLGRQFENAKQLPKAKNITYGDLFDESGKKYKSKE